METKHTPGPWTIEPSWADRCGGSVAIANRDHPGEDWDVCSVHSSEANTHLIASAPELLAAATRVTDAFKAHGKAVGIVDDNRTSQECEAVMLALDAAIAKATGRTG